MSGTFPTSYLSRSELHITQMSPSMSTASPLLWPNYKHVIKDKKIKIKISRNLHPTQEEIANNLHNCLELEQHILTKGTLDWIGRLCHWLCFWLAFGFILSWVYDYCTSMTPSLFQATPCTPFPSSFATNKKSLLQCQWQISVWLSFTCRIQRVSLRLLLPT